MNAPLILICAGHCLARMESRENTVSGVSLTCQSASTSRVIRIATIACVVTIATVANRFGLDAWVNVVTW